MSKIITAIIKHDYILAKYFINIGEEKLDIQDTNGKTALMYSIDQKMYHITKELIEAKCNLNICDKNSMSAIDYVFRSENKEVIRMVLVDNSYDLNFHCNTILKYIQQDKYYDLIRSFDKDDYIIVVNKILKLYKIYFDKLVGEHDNVFSLCFSGGIAELNVLKIIIKYILS
ncbi:MAG: hypothetical protein Edafosvirus9_25 [Edafosvirus sp.]|uniref:Uncharacterized protein n=1 Tax=Edafosvirus sp. TaxID=2487765 RepID=A0A3G4ZWE7_9VIRU|nr:MAG: hypothetical protein Edafosvirus9_25 [Edafosvirus sp.]